MSDEKPINKRLSGLRPFRPGQSGNPGGRAKRGFDLRTLARERTAEALARLVAIMRDPNASSMARVRAAEAILDRGWGKPIAPQSFVDSDGDDRPFPGELKTDLEKARRIAHLLAEGMRSLPAPQPQLESAESDIAGSRYNEPSESPEQSKTYSEEL